MLDNGLLLVPEKITFPQVTEDGLDYPGGSFIWQLRCCFTLLQENELIKHSAKFGCFSFQFEVEALRALGAYPVFYIPRPTGKDFEWSISSFGINLVHQIRDMVTLLRNLLDLQQMVQAVEDKNAMVRFHGDAPGKMTVGDLEMILGHLGAPSEGFQNLYDYGQALTNLFYHADSARQGNLGAAPDLNYYSQREWRVISGFVAHGKLADRELNGDEIQRLEELFPMLGAGIELPNGRNVSRAQISRLLIDSSNRPWWTRIRRIFVPDLAYGEVAQELKTRAIPEHLLEAVDYREILNFRAGK
ncbi:hypothetical protein [Variovorax sp. dw_954]|uniref:hypothetical protein n=1 Tax=Variovorax sp. dw_954 TaxID=2720078 RepID=UPI001BD31E03|nr:hypothetical protein [Variovorax sp. dw_954]